MDVCDHYKLIQDEHSIKYFHTHTYMYPMGVLMYPMGVLMITYPMGVLMITYPMGVLMITYPMGMLMITYPMGVLIIKLLHQLILWCLPSIGAYTKLRECFSVFEFFGTAFN